MRVLVDNSVWSAARSLMVAHSVCDLVTASFGLKNARNFYRVRDRDNNPKADQIEWLPTVRQIFLEQRATAIEIEISKAENLRGQPFPNSNFGNLLAGVTSEFVAWPVQPPSAVIEKLYLGFNNDEKLKKQFKDAAIVLGEWLLRQGHSSTALLKELKKIGVFEHHPADCLHFWMTVYCKIDIYLTMDSAFRKAIENKKHFKGQRIIMFPEEFCKQVEYIKPLPLPYAYGQEFDVFGREISN